MKPAIFIYFIILCISKQQCLFTYCYIYMQRISIVHVVPCYSLHVTHTNVISEQSKLDKIEEDKERKREKERKIVEKNERRLLFNIEVSVFNFVTISRGRSFMLLLYACLIIHYIRYFK